MYINVYVRMFKRTYILACLYVTQWVCLSVGLFDVSESVCLYVCLCVCLFACLPVWVFRLSVCTSTICTSVHLFCCMLVCLSVCRLSVCLSVCLSVSASVHMYVCLTLPCLFARRSVSKLVHLYVRIFGKIVESRTLTVDRNYGIEKSLIAELQMLIIKFRKVLELRERKYCLKIVE